MNTISTRLYKSPFPSYIASLEPRYIFDAAAAAAGADMAADLAAQSEAEGQIALALNGDNTHSVAAQSLQDQSRALGLAASFEVTPNSKALVFVDAHLGAQEIQTLQDGLPDSATMHLIHSDSDALAQIAHIVADYQSVESLHILSHGSAGVLSFGAADIDFNALSPEQKSALVKISASTTDDSDILIYGCDFAAGEMGKNAVAQLAQLTNADIAASDDATGSTELGADWEFEVTVGEIEAALPFNSTAQENFPIVLNSILVDYSQGAKLWLDANDRGNDDSQWKNKGNGSSVLVTRQGSESPVAVTEMNGKHALAFDNDVYYGTNLHHSAKNTAIIVHQPSAGDSGTALSAYSEGALNIGADAQASPESKYKGKIAEVILFNRALSQAELLIVNNGLSAKWAHPINPHADLYQGDDVVRGDFDEGVVGILRDTSGSAVLDNANAGLKISATNTLQAGQSVFMGHRAITAPEHSSNREWFVSAQGEKTPVNLSFNRAEVGLGSIDTDVGQYRLVKYNGSSWGLVAEANQSGKTISFMGVTLEDQGVYRIVYDAPVIETAPVMNTLPAPEPETESSPEVETETKISAKLPAEDVTQQKQGSLPTIPINIQLQGADGKMFSAGSRADQGFETIRQAENLNLGSSNPRAANENIAELEEITVSTQQSLSVRQAEKALMAFADKPEARVQLLDKIRLTLDSEATILGLKERDLLNDLVTLAMEQENIENQTIIQTVETVRPEAESVIGLIEKQQRELEAVIELAGERLIEPELDSLEGLEVPSVPVEEIANKELDTPPLPTPEAPELTETNEQEFSAQLQAANGIEQKSALLINASAA